MKMDQVAVFSIISKIILKHAKINNKTYEFYIKANNHTILSKHSKRNNIEIIVMASR